MPRRPLIAGNWKMNLGTRDEALGLVRRLRGPLSEVDGVDVVLCPPSTVLAAVAEVIGPWGLGLGAQTMHWEERGAHTGEISPSMLAGLCSHVILGHSERRASSGPSAADEAVARKTHAALDHGLVPIVCVGESLEQREAGQTDDFVGGQVRAALGGLDTDQVERCVVAYEPIWSIGTGRAASPADANRTVGLTIRGAISELHGSGAAQAVRVLYGGSVTEENVDRFMVMPEIDGALVGGASLDLRFADLVRAAVRTPGT